MTLKSIPKVPAELLKQVREACKHYDKPKRLGKLPLAGVALQALLFNPAHATDLTGRGQALRRVIGLVLDEMKPTALTAELTREAPIEVELYFCLYIHLYKRDPYTHVPIADVRTYLDTHDHIGILGGTYFNRLKKAIPLLSYLLSGYLGRQTTWSEPIPMSQGFMGREKELAHYRTQLERHRLVVIEGVGGVGKTALGARLGESIQADEKRPVCWLTIRAGLNETPNALLYAWAAFLAQHDYPHLWAFMRATAKEPNKQRELSNFFPHLREGLAKVQPLLCLDNLELLSDSAASSLLEMAHQCTSLLLISQQRPSLSQLGDYPLLTGLSAAEVQRFMRQHDIALRAEDAERVTKYTLGNPRLLELWSTHLRQGGSLAESKATRYFLSDIVSSLTDGQQRAALMLALCRRPLDSFLLQSPPKALPPLSDLQIEADEFDTLRNLGLIYSDKSSQWSLSPLLSDYLSAQLGETSEMAAAKEVCHEWLSGLYTLQGNTLEAAYHAICAQESERAILLLAEQQHLLIEQGHAAGMIGLLKSIQADDLSKPVRQVLRDLRRELWQLLGDYAAAEAEARQAAQEAITIAQQARTERIRGELAKGKGNVWQAADHYQHALRLLAIKESTLEAWLHRDLAWALMEQNDLDEAREEAQRAQIALQNTFGVIERRSGDFEQALNHFQQAATYARDYGERRELARINNSLAILYWKRAQSHLSIEKYMSSEQQSATEQLIQENFKQAITIYQENLHLMEEIGELVGKAITLLNMASCYAGLGKLHTSIQHLEEALATFSILNDNKGKILARLNLAEQHLRLGQLEEARQYAEAATQIDQTLVPPGDYAEALRIYAEVLLAQNSLPTALTTAHQALEMRGLPNTQDDAPEAFTDPFYSKLTCESLARIYKAHSEMSLAAKYDALAQQLGEKLS